MPDVTPGREQDFERMRAWLSASAAIDAVIEAADPGHTRERPGIVRPLPQALVAAYAKSGRPRTARHHGWQAERAGT